MAGWPCGIGRGEAMCFWTLSLNGEPRLGVREAPTGVPFETLSYRIEKAARGKIAKIGGGSNSDRGGDECSLTFDIDGRLKE